MISLGLCTRHEARRVGERQSRHNDGQRAMEVMR